MKERLLGAAVLVIAGIVVIPALLDGPPRDRGGEARTLTLPAPEAPGQRTHVVDLASDADGAQEAATAAGDKAASSVATLPPARHETMPAADTAPVTINRAPAPQPAPQPAAGQGAEATGGWAVQVGSFTSETNARRLEQLLKASGYSSFVMRNVVDGRIMYRVRVGPETDRARAEVLAERLRDDRQQAQLVPHP